MTYVLAGALVDPDGLPPATLAEACQAPGWRRLLQRVHAPDVASSPAPGPAALTPRALGHEQWLHRAWRLHPDEALAASSAWSDGVSGVHWRLDPVHAHLGRDRVVLAPPHSCPLDHAEAQALAQAITPVLHEAGLLLQCPTPTRWYLTETDPSQPWRLHTASLQRAIGQPMDTCLPEGPDARRWRRLFNDIQMTWYEHPVNQARLARGVLPVNAVWIEGRVPAQCPPDGPARAHAWWSDPQRPPDLAQAEPNGLMLDTRLLAAQQAGDPQAWLQTWRSLDAELFTPWHKALATAHPDRAQLVLTGLSAWRALPLTTGAPGWHTRLRRLIRRDAHPGRGAALLQAPPPAQP